MESLPIPDHEESMLDDETVVAAERFRPKEPGSADLTSLIERMAHGREEALGELYDATVPLIYGLALRITRSPQVAEEVSAATYWQAWVQARRFDINRGSPRSWLISIARSRALDAIRQIEVAKRRLPAESEIPDEFSTQADPQDLLQAVERTALLHAALRKLDPLPRQLIALAFFKGLTHAEIAAHVEVPLGTVKSHIRRAMGTLRETLKTAANHRH